MNQCFHRALSFTAIAAFFISSANAANIQPREIEVPSALMDQLKSFEPSGSVYLEDLGAYLIVSDDTDKKDRPLLFLMNEKGEVEEEPLNIQGIKKMTDIESVSQDSEGNLYFLSSLGLNKNGKEKVERNFFVRASRDGKKIKATGALELRPLLLEALAASNDPAIKKLKRKLEDKLDVESSYIKDGTLFIGLKEPQPEGGLAVILKVGNVDEIFSSESIDGKEFEVATFNFGAVSGDTDLLSEMLPIGDSFFFCTTTDEGNGRLWKADAQGGNLEIVQEFQGLKPEGLAYRKSENDLLVVFDQGEEEAQFGHYSLE